jgi:hypothetical protein
MNSILRPVALDQSYIDGAFSIAEIYGPLLDAIKTTEKVDHDVPISPSGLFWAMAGGEIAGMRNTNTMAVRGIQDVEFVFDRIESGTFATVDFIEAYICPDGCVSGQLVIEGRYAAQRNIQQIARKLGDQGQVKEEKVRSLLREHFFDLEEEIKARPARALGRDLKQRVAMKKEKAGVLEQLPKKDCAACGAPDCETLAEDIVLGERMVEDCLFVRIASLTGDGVTGMEGRDE